MYFLPVWTFCPQSYNLPDPLASLSLITLVLTFPCSLGALGFCFFQGILSHSSCNVQRPAEVHVAARKAANSAYSKACQMASHVSFSLAFCLLISPAQSPLVLSTVCHQENILQHSCFNSKFFQSLSQSSEKEKFEL